MSELYDDIARGCLENGEPIEARWGSGEWTPQPEQEQPPTDMDIWNDLQRQLDQLRAENERLQQRIAELEQERRWIPVSDRLPECGEVVNWSHPRWKRTKEGYMTGSGRLKVWGGEYYKINKMNWQPLPQPPKEGE